MRFRLLFILLLKAFTATSQVSLYVDSSKTTSGAGTSWTTAYKTLGEALSTANANSTSAYINIYVAKGTYYPPGVQSSADRDSSFELMRGGLWLHGGYPSGGGMQNITANPTILSGNIGNAGDSTDNSYHVLVATGINGFQPYTDTLILEGLTVAYGAATGTGTRSYKGYNLWRTHGGGMIATSVWRIVVRRSRFINNHSAHNGGGFNIGSSSTLQTDSATFSGNTADTSGGAIFSSGALIVARSAFTGNTAGRGGAICHASVLNTLSMKNTVLTANRAVVGSGGAVDVPGYGTFLSSWLLDSLTFTGNSAVTTGGAFSTPGGWSTIATPTLRFRAGTFTGNTAGTGGGALYTTGIMKLVVDTCNFTANKTVAGDGGAIRTDVGGPAELNGSTFMADSATASGGGALYTGNYLTARYCTFTNNYCSSDGGAYRSDQYTGADLEDCTFDSNVAGGGGGGICMGIGNVTRCRIRGNRALGFNGGGILQIGHSSNINNTLLSGNVGVFGGAMAITSWIGTTITNCTMAGNADQGGGEAIFGNGGVNITMTNCIVWENASNGLFINWASSFTVTHTTVRSGWSGTGNNTTDPLFVLPLPGSAAPTTGGDYSLSPCSPAINAGANIGSYTGINDLAGNPRLDAQIVDRGAYEFQQSLVAGTITGNASVCVGNSQQFTATVSGGTWSNPGPVLLSVNSTGYAMAGTVAGIDTLLYTVVSGGCAYVAAKVITVTAPPVITAINGASTVCANGNTQLSNSTPGGVWRSSNTAVATVGATGMVTGVSPGTVTIFYKVTNSGGCADSVSKVLTVTAPPAIAAITGPATGICLGSTLQLANATPGGVWSDNCFGSIFTVNNTGLVTGTNTGSCTVLYTITGANGCSASASYPLTVYGLPTPVITGPAIVCSGGAPVSYTGWPMGGTGTWATSTPSLGTISAGGLFTPLNSGYDTIIYVHTDINGCSADYKLPITINASPVNSVTANLCPGDVYVFGSQTLNAPGLFTETFTAANGCDSVVTLALTSMFPDTAVTVIGDVLMAVDTPASYQWMRCETNGSKTPLTGQTNRTFIVPATGMYALSIIKNGCTAVGNCRMITPSGVTDVRTTDFVLYPNPTTGKVTIKNGTTILRSIIVHDIAGHQLMTVQTTGPETVLELGGLAPGTYLVTITDVAGYSHKMHVTLISR